MLDSGTITFLFTDIQGSTQLWEQYPDSMRIALDQHHTLLHSVMRSHDGKVFKIVGDEFQVAFTNPAEAVKAAIEAQRQLKNASWPNAIGEIRVRIGIHTGEAHLDGSGDYAATHTLNRVARISSAGHGGQILISLVSAELARPDLGPAIRLIDLGEHSLKGLSYPERIFQIEAPGLERAFPHLNTLSRPMHNLPKQRTAFIGRDKEIAQVIDLLSSSRLVTLTGIGGVGKTRLALKVAEALIEEYRDGVWLVELANILEPSLVTQSIASVFSLTEGTDSPLDEVLKRYLSRRQLLLVIDNLEHLLACASFVGELLAAALQLSILVTSREHLHIYGEQEYPVHPLNLPGSFIQSNLEDLINVESVALFIMRARAVDPAFSPDDKVLADLTRICLTLDGLPLAIELCAPMIKIFPPDVIADRIEKSLDVIPSGPRDLPARQQTLQDAIQWSFDLLQEHEKRLFVRLAVFNGGGTLQAVEAICGHGISGKMENILSDLVNKNLVIARKGQDGDIHFSLLETIRQYGRDKLRVLEEAEEIADRHTQYYMKLAKQAAVELRGPDQISWTDRLLAIQDNIRAALDRLIESGEVETALRFSCDLYEFWLRHSDIEEGRRWLEQVMKLPGAQEYQELYTNTLINLAWLLWLQYKKESKPLVEQALDLARAYTSQSNTAKALATLGMISINQGNITQAQDYLEEGSQIYHAIQEEWGYARSCMGLAVIQKVQNQYEAASALYSKAYHLYKKIGDIHFQCVVLRLIGDLELKCNNLTGGTDAYRESLMIARAVKSNLQVANNLWGLARVAKLQGNQTRAVQLFLASKKVFEDIGAWWSGDDPELEEVLTTAQVALGEPEFLSVREHGHHMTMEMAIELALGNAGDI